MGPLEVAVRVLVWVIALALAAPAAAEPRRVVSLDFCADQFVLALADRGQIAALSRGARREDSYYRARAEGFREIRPEMEEVLALHPDLVVRTFGGDSNAARAYGRFGVPVLQLGDVASFAAARAQMLGAAAAFGHPARGGALARDLDLRLARLRAEAPADPAPVLYLSAAGAVAGRGTMMDAVIRAAGARNAASTSNWSVLPLEKLVRTPPALIALGFFETRRTQMNAWSPSRHPAFRAALARAETVGLPAAAMACEAWYNIDAAERIAAALRRVR